MIFVTPSPVSVKTVLIFEHFLLFREFALEKNSQETRAEEKGERRIFCSMKAGGRNLKIKPTQANSW